MNTINVKVDTILECLGIWPWEQGIAPVLVTEQGSWYLDKILSDHCTNTSGLQNMPALKAQVFYFKPVEGKVETVVVGMHQEVIIADLPWSSVATRIMAIRLSYKFIKEEFPTDWKLFEKSEYTLWEEWKHVKRGMIKSRKFGF